MIPDRVEKVLAQNQSKEKKKIDGVIIWHVEN